MILAAVTCVVWQYTLYKETWLYPVVPGLIVGILAFVIISLLTAKPSQQVRDMVKTG